MEWELIKYFSILFLSQMMHIWVLGEEGNNEAKNKKINN